MRAVLSLMLVLVLGRTTRVGMLMGVLMLMLMAVDVGVLMSVHNSIVGMLMGMSVSVFVLMFMAMIVLAFHRVSSVFPSGAETSLGDPMLSRSEDRGDRI